jgi:taurine dioxygenase
MPPRSTNLDSSVVVRPLAEAFVAEVVGVDLSSEVSDAAFGAIHDAFLQFQVLVFRNQELTPTRHVEFARRFGEVQTHVLNRYHHDEHPELFFLSNLDERGEPNGQHPDRGTLYWHTDGSWTKRTTKATLIYSVEVPRAGGETHFADMYRAYESLPEVTKQRIAGLQAVHNLDFSRTRRHGEDPLTEAQRQRAPAIDHPIVRTHPETARKCLFLGDHAERVVGFDYGEGRALIEELTALATRPLLVYRHEWRPRELIVWDNRCVLHRATSFDTARERRVMRRSTVLADISQ